MRGMRDYDSTMSRTTLNIDTPLLEELRKLQKRDGRSLGEVVSELLAEALAYRSSRRRSRSQELSWIKRPMGARVDISDKEALYAALDSEPRGPSCRRVSYSIDVNILLYGSDASSPFHERAIQFMESCAKSSDPLFLTYMTLMSYVRITTHPRIFTDPLTPQEAFANVEKLSNLPQVRLVSERDGFVELYKETTEDLTVRANLVPDAHLATLLRQHAVSTLYTNNTNDFARFDFLKIRNPLAATL